MKRAFLIHGYVGVPDDAWKPWLRSELEDNGFAVEAPRMPDPAHPRLSPWLETISEVARNVDENCYFVGHSLGSAAILRYLETLDDSVAVGGAVMIAGFASTTEPELQTFFARPFDWETLRKRCRRYVAINSSDDPHVALRNGEVFGEKLGARLIVESGKGHFGASDGILELPSALEAVLAMST